jgi:hypothetical protein
MEMCCKLQLLGQDKKTETRPNSKIPIKNKVIWAVYNGSRVSGLKIRFELDYYGRVRIEKTKPTVVRNPPA